MLKINLLVLLLILCSCNKRENGEVTLIKQWHLSSSQRTEDIQNSRKLAQFQNQKDIFLQVSNLIKKKKTNVIIAEGCEGVIDEKFKTAFNGWSMTDLKKEVKEDHFQDIMAPVPMKIKAMYPKVSVVCGDNLDLIRKNLRSMSDLRGFSGFYQRLLQARKNDLNKFNAYFNQLKKLFPNENIIDPVQFSLKKSIKSLEDFEGYIKERNTFFLKSIKANLEGNPVVIIGGLHVMDLQKKLFLEKVKSHIVVPEGYSNDEQKLIFALKEILNNDLKRKVTFFQTPEGFEVKQFPTINLIKSKDLYSESEKKELKELAKDNIPFDLLKSDFDQDGIRDFTLSSSADGIVLSAEDPDWDNDGIPNLIDGMIGKIKIGNPSPEIRVNNNFLSNSNKDKILSLVKAKVLLGQEEGMPHELLVLELFNSLTEKTPLGKNQIKIIRATSPKFTYGENVFFSYIKHTNCLEYYPVKLNEYINKEYQKRFYGVDFKLYINSYVLPLLVHSLAHEVAHSLNYPYTPLSRENGWSWKNSNYMGKYLKEFRHPLKRVKEIKTNLLFKRKNFTDWMGEFKDYTKSVNQILRTKSPEEALLKASRSKYFTNIKSKEIEHNLSFLSLHNLASVYALKNPNEWFAENYATCIYKLIYPKSKTRERSVELEHLLGINPLATNASLCRKLLK